VDFQLFHSRRRKKITKDDRETDVSETGKPDRPEYGTFQGSSVNAASSPTPPPYSKKRSRMPSYRMNGVIPKNEPRKNSSLGSTNSMKKASSVAVTKQSDNLFNNRPGFLMTRPIKIRRRLYEFYTAPITTFWAWTISFCLFLTAFTYVLLVRTPKNPTWLEWVLFAYVIAFGMEHFRKFLMSEMQPIGQKLKYFFYNYWNTVTAIAVVSFLFGFGMRAFGVITTGRVILACNSVLWTMKMLDYMSVHPRLGPYITMAGKMILNMTYIVVMLVVSLLAFGLARQSITYPNEDFHWLLVRNIFYKPYFMLYGEVYADEID
ncbi:unnamed protein product, partial [Cylicostephanus goldi]